MMHVNQYTAVLTPYGNSTVGGLSDSYKAARILRNPVSYGANLGHQSRLSCGW
jgi:hypothetical protein